MASGYAGAINHSGYSLRCGFGKWYDLVTGYEGERRTALTKAMTAGRRPEPIGILILSMAELHAFWAEITTFSPVSLVAGPSLRQSTQILMCAFMRSCDPCGSPSLLQTCSISVLEVYRCIVLRCPGYSNGNAKLRYHTHECKQHMSLSKTAASSRFDGPRTCQAPLITQVNIRSAKTSITSHSHKTAQTGPFRTKVRDDFAEDVFRSPRRVPSTTEEKPLTNAYHEVAATGHLL